jgi:methylated-DNA-protein-cysteine methyltransferase-like protein
MRPPSDASVARSGRSPRRPAGDFTSPITGESFAEHVYRLTKMIPRGQVATYGQIATYVSSPRFARAVGTALRNLPRKRSKEVPWQRVINAAGRISARGDVHRPTIQERLLKAEGVVFDRTGRTNLAIFQWAGPGQGRIPTAKRKPSRDA